MTTSTPVSGPTVELRISGMTCASCANRIERSLNKLDGVAATVNYATEKASVTVPGGYDPAQLIAEVEKAGYTAALPTPDQSSVTTTAFACARSCAPIAKAAVSQVEMSPSAAQVA